MSSSQSNWDDGEQGGTVWQLCFYWDLFLAGHVVFSDRLSLVSVKSKVGPNLESSKFCSELNWYIFGLLWFPPFCSYFFFAASNNCRSSDHLQSGKRHDKKSGVTGASVSQNGKQFDFR